MEARTPERREDVTVLIATRNRPDALSACLDALVTASSQLPGEVVVVDQSDDDATRALVDRLAADGLRVAYERQPPLGLGAAQNRGADLVSGEVIAVTDDDCIVDPGWVQRIADAFESEPGLAAVTGRVLPLPPAGDRTEAVATRPSEVARRFRGKALPWLVGSGNNFAVRRTWFKAIGGCDVRLGPGSPGQGAVDMDLFYRLLRAGATIAYDPACLVHHERQTPAGRMERRYPYGYGIGVEVAQLVLERDLYGLRILAAWLPARMRALAAGARRGDATRVGEEAAILRGTVAGLLHPLRRRSGLSGRASGA